MCNGRLSRENQHYSCGRCYAAWKVGHGLLYHKLPISPLRFEWHGKQQGQKNDDEKKDGENNDDEKKDEEKKDEEKKDEEKKGEH